MIIAKSKYEYINILIEKIENIISHDAKVETLMRLGFVSHTQIYRDFYSVTGHSVKEYIRKRRLSNVLALIKSSELPLADIAYQCGYSSQQALCRSIQNALHMTPLEYKNSDNHYFFPPYTGCTVQGISVSTETIPKTLCVKFYQSRLKDIENIAVSTFLKLVPEYNGRIFGRNGVQDKSRFCYELYLTDSNCISTLTKTSEFDLSFEKSSYRALFAMSAVENDVRKINEAWNYLYSDWLQNSMFIYTEEQYFEEFVLKNGKPVKLRLYLPIKKRNDPIKIKLLQNPQIHFLVSEASGYNAEQHASKTIFDFLHVNYPYLAKSSKEYYIHKGTNAYTCGVKVNFDFNGTNGKNIHDLYINKGFYLELYSCVMGDYDKYSNFILTFAYNNGLIADKHNIFAVYNVNDSFVNPKIKMYCPVKLVQNDNTSYKKNDRIKL